jgi:hypothetical protein
MTPHEYPYTFTEAMARVSQTVKVTSCFADTYPMDSNAYTYHLDDNFKLKDEEGDTPNIYNEEIDSMWREIK